MSAEYFGKTDLAYVFNKCQNDNRLKYNCMISIDNANGMNKYEKSTIENQHHEAAFDAYMTGFCFPLIIKFKDAKSNNRGG